MTRTSTTAGGHFPPGVGYQVLLIALLLLAAIVRIVSLHDAPPGLQHDEMFKALEGRRLLESGDFRVFYPTNQGHEGGYVWALAASMALLGVNVLSIKFPAFVFGMLSVALIIRLAGKLEGRRAALIAGGLATFSFFAVFTSRVGLRAAMLPMFVLWLLLALYEMVRGSSFQGQRHSRYKHAFNAGLALGLSIYSYTSAFALWGGVAALTVALILFDRPKFRLIWRQLLMVAVLGIVLNLPMLTARVTDPQGFNRSSTLTRPLTDALAGRPHELLDNGLKLLGMAAFTGDPEARYNVPGRPLFLFPVGLLAYAGLALVIWRVRRQPIYAALIGIMAAGLIPSLLTVSAPSFLRSIALLPCLIMCVAVAIDQFPGQIGWGVGLVAVALTGLLDLRTYFIEWPRLPEIAAIYRDDLEQLARAVKDSDGLWLVSTPDVEQDALTFSLYAGSAAERVAFFDGDTTIAFAEGERLAVSPLSPLTSPHQSFITPEYGAKPEPDILSQDGSLAFDVSRIESSEIVHGRLDLSASGSVYLWPDNAFSRGELTGWADPASYPVNFGGLVALSGIELSDRTVAPEFDGVNLQLFLQPLVEHPDLPLSVFVHVYRQNNSRLHAQRDLMGMPPSQWLPGVVIVQDNFIVMGRTRPGWYVVAVGVYNVVTGERLPILNASGAVLGDRVLIGRIHVGE